MGIYSVLHGGTASRDVEYFGYSIIKSYISLHPKGVLASYWKEGANDKERGQILGGNGELGVAMLSSFFHFDF